MFCIVGLWCVNCIFCIVGLWCVHCIFSISASIRGCFSSLRFLSFSLISSRESVAIDFQKELSSGLLLKLVKSSIQASKDKDRVRLIPSCLAILQPADIMCSLDGNHSDLQ